MISLTKARDKRVYNISNSEGCAFACHIRITKPNGKIIEDLSDNYNVAIDNHVTTRIDVVAKATARLFKEASDNRGNNKNLYSMGVYTFGKSAENMQLQEVVAPTTDLEAAAEKANENVQLMTIPFQGYNDDRITSFETAFGQLVRKLGRPGTARTRVHRRRSSIWSPTGSATAASRNLHKTVILWSKWHSLPGADRHHHLRQAETAGLHHRRALHDLPAATHG